MGPAWRVKHTFVSAQQFEILPAENPTTPYEISLSFKSCLLFARQRFHSHKFLDSYGRKMASNLIHRDTQGGHALNHLSNLATTQPGHSIRPPRPTPIPPRPAPIHPKAPSKQVHSTLKSRYERAFTDWWLWEVLAVLFSLGTFSALVTILIVYDGHSIAHLPQRLSLNAIISILSTISRTTLMFSVSATLSQFKWLSFSGRTRQLKNLQLYDDASRGPLGSSILLMSEKGRWVWFEVHEILLLTFN